MVTHNLRLWATRSCGDSSGAQDAGLQVREEARGPAGRRGAEERAGSTRPFLGPGYIPDSTATGQPRSLTFPLLSLSWPGVGFCCSYLVSSH